MDFYGFLPSTSGDDNWETGNLMNLQHLWSVILHVKSEAINTKHITEIFHRETLRDKKRDVL